VRTSLAASSSVNSDRLAIEAVVSIVSQVSSDWTRIGIVSAADTQYFATAAPRAIQPMMENRIARRFLVSGLDLDLRSLTITRVRLA